MNDKAVVLLTASSDATADVFMERHGSLAVRVDADDDTLVAEWSSSRGPRLAGIPVGEIESIYWRKPFLPEASSDDASSVFERAQRRYLLKSLCQHAASEGVWMLVDPHYDARTPRTALMHAAAEFFSVPAWQVCSGLDVELGRERVVKSLVPIPVDGKHFMSTQRVPSDASLCGDFTWFAQDCISASHDVTVVYCCGETWSFELDRSSLGEQVDWRLFFDHHLPGSWKRIALNQGADKAIDRYMRSLGLPFGRLDFLRELDGHLWFLEVNPNGQFGWLEPSLEFGMQERIFAAAIARPKAWP